MTASVRSVSCLWPVDALLASTMVSDVVGTSRSPTS
jgi:hypothetical protein